MGQRAGGMPYEKSVTRVFSEQVMAEQTPEGWRGRRSSPGSRPQAGRWGGWGITSSGVEWAQARWRGSQGKSAAVFNP